MDRKYILPALIVVGMMAAAGFSQTNACGCEAEPLPAVWATVNSVKFGAADLDSGTAARVANFQDEVTNARKNELSVQINTALLELEAAKRGVTTKQLLDVEVSQKAKVPTEQDARALYEAHKAEIGASSYEEVKDKIFDKLRYDNNEAVASAFATQLRASYQVKQLVEFATPPATPADLSRKFATIGTKVITSKDIEDALQPMILSVQKEVYDLRKTAIDRWINDKLLADEAKKRGVAPVVLIDQEVGHKMTPITDADALAFYNENKSRINGEFAAMKPQIIQFLHDQQSQERERTFANSLRATAAIKYFIKEPPLTNQP